MPITAAKAALLRAFVYHELKLALVDFQADPTLSKLVAPPARPLRSDPSSSG